MSDASLPTRLGRDGTYAGRSVDVLRAMILDGRIGSGERLNEVHLSQALGISRGPLREALQRLASEGLLEVIPHRGSFVRSFTTTELRDLYQLRIAIECHAVRLAAENAEVRRVQGLREELRRAEQLMHTTDPYPAQLDFHRGVLELADTVPLVEAATSVAHRISLARSTSAQQPARARAALEEHHAVLDAISDGDGDRAAALLREHLERSLHNAVQLLESQH